MQTVHCPCCEFVFAGRAAGQNRCQYCGTVIPGLPSGHDLIPVIDHPDPVLVPGRPDPVPAALTPDQGGPAAEIMLALSEPCGLGAAELARLVPDRPPGTCSSCHLPLPPGRPWKCCWCQALADLRPASAPEKTLAGPRTAVSRRARRGQAAPLLAAGALACLLLIAVFVSPWYVIGYVVLLAAACFGRHR